MNFWLSDAAVSSMSLSRQLVLDRCAEDTSDDVTETATSFFEASLWAELAELF